MIRALRFAALAALFLGVSFGAGVIILFAWVAAAVELPTLIVEASDPGANASAVERTIAAPIEQQVNGVEHLRHQPCLVVCLGQANGAPPIASGSFVRSAERCTRRSLSPGGGLRPDAGPLRGCPLPAVRIPHRLRDLRA